MRLTHLVVCVLLATGCRDRPALSNAGAMSAEQNASSLRPTMGSVDGGLFGAAADLHAAATHGAPSAIEAGSLVRTLSGSLRGVSLDGFVASLGIVALAETGSGTGWRVALAPRPIEGCLGWDPRIALDFDTSDRVRPTGVVNPATIAVYRPSDPVPVYEGKAGSASRLEIVGRAPQQTADGIGHGELLGSIKFDVKLRDGLGSMTGETLLIDCSR